MLSLKAVEKYGFFDDTKDEFIITTPFTPRSWENRLWNERFNLQISNHGTGIAYTKNSKDKFVLFNYKCPNRFLYLLDYESGKLWSPSYYPVNEKLDHYEVRHGLKYTVFCVEKDKINVRWTVTVHYKDCAELWRIEIINKSKKKRKLLLAPFYQIDLSLKDPYFGEVNLFKSSVSEENHLLYIKNHAFIRRGEDDALAFHSDIGFRAYELSTKLFLKRFSTFSTPHTIIHNDWVNSAIDDENDPCFSAAFDISLRPSARKIINIAIFTAENFSIAKRKAHSYIKCNAFEKSMQAHAIYKKQLKNLNNINIKDKIFERYVNVWIKHQFWYNAEWNRGWGMGFRDSMSDCDMFRAFNPSLVRLRLIQASAHIYQDGHTVRSFFPPNEKPYFDGGIWFQNTLCQYIRETGDWGILEEKTTYFKSNEEDTILGHAKRTVDFLDKQRGPDKICRMGFGDWNDALNGVDRFGKGQSVWTTIAYIYGLKNLSEMLNKINDDDAKIYSQRAEELTQIVNAKFFESDRYIRAVSDAGRLIGSKTNKYGRIYIEPQGWALFSGVADKEKAEKILIAVKKELYVPYGILLLSPPYKEYEEDVGRISNDSPGLVENGSNYVHGSLFFAYGLAKAGFPDDAFEILCRLLPANPDNPPQNSFLEPFQITNSYRGPGAKNPGRAMFSWRTGAAGWFMKTIWDGLLGVLPDFDELCINAKIPQAFGKEFTAIRQIRGKNIKFCFSKQSKYDDFSEKTLLVQNGEKIKYERLSESKTIKIIF